jgi:hypothetical protein
MCRRRTIRKLARLVGIVHERAFTDRLYDIQWVDLARGDSWAPSDEGLILDGRNAVLLGRPSPSPARNFIRV